MGTIFKLVFELHYDKVHLPFMMPKSKPEQFSCCLVTKPATYSGL